MRFLSPKIHGILDYGYVAIFALAPSFLNLAGTAAILCYVIAVAVLALAFFTRYPLGVVKKIPFTVHGGIELAAALATMVSPWAFDFSAADAARNFFVFMGGALVLVWLVTDYKGIRTSTADIGARERDKAGIR